MLFALICTDKPNSSELRGDVRARHLAYIEARKAEVRVAGPFISEDGAVMTGSLIVIEAADLAGAQAFAAQDPYSVAGLFSSVDIRPWRWTFGVPKV